jgi:uncharacterized membrane protein HdeD (DUF308 family)
MEPPVDRSRDVAPASARAPAAATPPAPELPEGGVAELVLQRSWGVVMTRGVAGLALAFVALVSGVSPAGLIGFCAGYAFVDGAAALYGAFVHEYRKRPYWPVVAEGALGLLVGVIAVARPSAYLVMLLAVGLGEAAIGVLEGAAAWKLHGHGAPAGLIGLVGVATVVFGLVLVTRPGLGELPLMWVIAAFGVAAGTARVMMAMRLKDLEEGAFPRPLI